MGAQDKLIPTAIALANNLSGVKTSGNTFRLQPNIRTKWNNPFMDVVKFFASVYAKQNKMTTGDMSWNHELEQGSFINRTFPLDQRVNQLTLGTVLSLSEAEWNSFQLTLSACHNIIKWLPANPNMPYTDTEIMAMYKSTGVDKDISNTIYGADGQVLATNLSKAAPGYAWHKAWNTLKVPYDRVLKQDTPFIAPISPIATGGSSDWYRTTGDRQWFFEQTLVDYLPK